MNIICHCVDLKVLSLKIMETGLIFLGRKLLDLAEWSELVATGCGRLLICILCLEFYILNYDRKKQVKILLVLGGTV